MDKKDLKDPALFEFSLHHRKLAKRLVRNPRTGCLEYLGPLSQIAGNPLLSLHGGKESIHLRRYIWILHRGSIPKGRFVRMRCGNNLCQLPKHMVLSNYFRTYTPSPKEFASRFDNNTLAAIRFYDGKASRTALAKVFNIKASMIYGICVSKKVSNILPPYWRPDPKLERQVEDASCRYGTGFYLSPPTLRLALREIRTSRVSPLVREIVSETLKGASNRSLAHRLHRSKNGVMYIYRRGLVELDTELGYRRWIEICSHDRIQQWRKSPYTWKR